MKRYICLAAALAGWMVTSSAAERIELSTGEVLEARVVGRSAETLRVEHAILGVLTIPLEHVMRVDDAAGPPPQTAEEAPTQHPRAAEAAADMPAAAARAPSATSPPQKEEPGAQWNSAIEVGVTATEGTTQDANLRLAFRTARFGPHSRFEYDAWYHLTTSRGDRTENRFSTGAFLEQNGSKSRWRLFAQTRYDVAEFQAWDQRLTASGGLGYRLFHLEGEDEQGRPFDRFILIGRFGGGIRADFGSPNDTLSPEGLLGAEFAYRLSPQHALIGTTTFYPDFDDSSEFRWVSNLDWSVRIDRMDGVSLKLGLAHEYESRTAPRVPHNDLAIYASLVLDF